MKFLDALRSVLAWPFKAASGQSRGGFNPMDHEMVGRVFGNISHAGKAVNETASMRLSAAWACRRILSESIGMLPLSMYRKDTSGNAESATDYWLHDLLVRSPNRDQTSVEFRESMVLNLTGDGNAYAFIERAGNRVTSLTPMPSVDVQPMRKRGSNTKLNLMDGEIFFRAKDRDKTEDYPRDKVWHIKLFGYDSLRGLSPLRAAAESMGAALAQDEFAARFFANGAMPSAVVTFPQWLTADQKEAAQDAANKMAGLGRSHDVAVFQGGMKPEPWNT